MEKQDVINELGTTTRFSKNEIDIGIDILIQFYNMSENIAIKMIKHVIDIATVYNKSIIMTIKLLFDDKNNVLVKRK